MNKYFSVEYFTQIFTYRTLINKLCRYLFSKPTVLLTKCNVILDMDIVRYALENVPMKQCTTITVYMIKSLKFKMVAATFLIYKMIYFMKKINGVQTVPVALETAM